ncbi:hypothetical protein IFM89_015918 [Coptis chinensis]|uniref:Homeobox domain-containing protein n=1 Tax=Coptis chinensis TaxID=261450 RepID=A0A835LUE4_9MAGN|nr:hypothetical protein IFM89_015918 [Coptis chinensis]
MEIYNMRHMKEESVWMIDQPIDLNSAVEELHGLGSQELNKLLRESENYILQRYSQSGSMIQIDVEKLARCLPMHLIAVLVSSGRDETRLQYLLRGLRLLHSFSDLASRHTKLEQILLEDLKVNVQIMDLIFYTLVVLAHYKQDNRTTRIFPLLHSTLVSCSLYLLPGCISSQWQDLAQVLIAHPEVDLFMDAACNAVRIDIMFLRIKLSALNTVNLCNKSNPTPVQIAVYSLCQQCEASLQFLQSLCQQKSFREYLLKNKELCKNGGILSLVHAVLNLDAPHCNGSSKLAAAVSRMKSKVLSIVLKLLKTSFGRKQHLDIDENGFPRGFVLLNTMRLADIFSDDSNFRYLITTNITHVLAEILMRPHEEFLTSWCSADLSVVEEDASLEFDPSVAVGVVFMLLSSGLRTSKETNRDCSFNLNCVPEASYAQNRTSLLVKIFANLHCFVPNICEEQERNLFFNKFVECLRTELPNSATGFPFASNVQNAAIVCKNLVADMIYPECAGSLLGYAASLIPTFLNEEDVHLLSKFFKELQSLFTPNIEGNLTQEQVQDRKLLLSDFDAGICNQEIQSRGGYAPPLTRKFDQETREVPLDLSKSDYPTEETSESLLHQDNVIMVGRRNEKAESSASESLKETDKDLQNVETSGSEASSTRVKDSFDQLLDNGEFSKIAENENTFKEVVENDKRKTTKEEEKLRRKRKRNIMNSKQITLIEQALLDEPEMQRNAASLQSWADKLSVHGSELTCSQLKNWVNNRKAKLLRVAREGRAPSEGENAFPDKSGGLGQLHFYDSPESHSEDYYVPLTTRRGSNLGITKASVSEISEAAATNFVDFAAQQSIQINGMSMRYVRFEPGQYVCLLDKERNEIGKGKVYLVEGVWHGNCLEEVGTCVVDIIELKVQKCTRLQHPSEAAGTTFDEAEARNGVMRVAWDANDIMMLPH